MTKKELGQRIKELRSKKNITQQDVADYLHLKNKSTVGSWEIGKSEPDIDIFVNLCKLFGLSPNEFFNFEENTIITLSEKIYLEKYRKLDSVSKDIINYITDKELDRITNVEGKPKYIKSIPLSDFSLSAGTGNLLLDNTYEMIEIDGDEYPNADMAFRVKGDSMEPRYYDGDIVYIHRQPVVEPGEIGAFLYNDEQYLKKLVQEDGFYKLRSLNKKYKDIIIDNDSLMAYGKILN